MESSHAFVKSEKKKIIIMPFMFGQQEAYLEQETGLIFVAVEQLPTHDPNHGV